MSICGIYYSEFFPAHGEGEERERREGEGESSQYRISHRIQKFPFLDLLEMAFSDGRASFTRKAGNHDFFLFWKYPFPKKEKGIVFGATKNVSLVPITSTPWTVLY